MTRSKKGRERERERNDSNSSSSGSTNNHSDSVARVIIREAMMILKKILMTIMEEFGKCPGNRKTKSNCSTGRNLKKAISAMGIMEAMITTGIVALVMNAQYIESVYTCGLHLNIFNNYLLAKSLK